ncbi:unnamed protein product [Trifolium pratense]|uniref:Uncharacterized protein n=1 Tax=Trifolium pratense TaxID=57577 RepID=A0ACB0JLW5_TRIPR|nr:unnamed protein product [Trifolium pratense]
MGSQDGAISLGFDCLALQFDVVNSTRRERRRNRLIKRRQVLLPLNLTIILAYHGLSSKTKESGSLMCHQCQRNDKSGVVFCSSCNRKRYCYECIENWYPGKTREDFKNACPFCWGNCKACLREFPVLMEREVNASVKLPRLLYLLSKALPVLRHIHREQSLELETEIKIRGKQLQEVDITRTKLDESERLYWKSYEGNQNGNLIAVSL